MGRTVGVHALAPRSLSTSAAFTSVPAVSIMSSMITQLRPSISPITCMTSDTLALGRRLSMMPGRNPAAWPVHGLAPRHPRRGDDDRVFVVLLAQVAQQHRRRVDVVHGDVEETLIWSACRSAVSTRATPTACGHVGHHLGRDRHTGRAGGDGPGGRNRNRGSRR